MLIILNKSAGFTLIEIVAGLSILSLAVLALMPLVSQTSDWAGQSEDYMTAGYLVPAIIQAIDADTDDTQSILAASVDADGRTVLTPETVSDLGLFSDYPARIGLTTTPEPRIDGHRVHIEVFRDHANDIEDPVDVVIAEGYTFVHFDGGDQP